MPAIVEKENRLIWHCRVSSYKYRLTGKFCDSRQYTDNRMWRVQRVGHFSCPLMEDHTPINID